MNRSFLQKIRTVKTADILSFFLFLIALPVSLFYRKKRKHIWLICEYGPEARDNAYYLFRYLREEKKDVDAVYALDRDSIDRDRVTTIGEVVNYGSLRHWVYYLSAEVNISSQKGGKPNAAVCYILEVVTGLLKNTRVFLQHGIIKDDLPFLHYDKTKMSLFICSIQREFEFVRDTFGYPDGAVVLTGLCRYDNLFSVEKGKSIAIMPTWREWLFKPGQMEAVENTSDFKETVFYKNWSHLIKELLTTLEDSGVKIRVCLHRNLQQYNEYFREIDPCIEVVDLSNGDVIDVLKESSCMISDYSSVAIDFAYLRKPLAYYQADYEQFRKNHLPEGYYDYEKDGFGRVFYEEKPLVDWVKGVSENGFVMEEEYAERVEKFFTFCDRKYCERNYNAIVKMLEEKNEKRKQS